MEGREEIKTDQKKEDKSPRATETLFLYFLLFSIVKAVLIVTEMQTLRSD